MRVRFSSLRCFFFAIRLRRFLMTEPTVYLSLRPLLRHRLATAGVVDSTDLTV